MTDQPTAPKPAKSTSLGRAFQQIGSLTAISRIVGFMRDIAFAGFLGAGPARCLSGGVEIAKYVSPP